MKHTPVKGGRTSLEYEKFHAQTTPTKPAPASGLSYFGSFFGGNNETQNNKTLEGIYTKIFDFTATDSL